MALADIRGSVGTPDARSRAHAYLHAKELFDADTDRRATAPQPNQVLRVSAVSTHPQYSAARCAKQKYGDSGRRHRRSEAIVPDFPGELERVQVQTVRI